MPGIYESVGGITILARPLLREQFALLSAIIAEINVMKNPRRRIKGSLINERHNEIRPGN